MDKRESLPSVLISAFACEPDRGSEPSVGWNWSLNLAENFRVTVLTREAHRESIDEWRERQPKDSFACSIRFIYYDPPSLFCEALDAGRINFQMMYVIWQVGAYFKVRNNLTNYDILHHVTYNTLMFMGVWWTRKCKIILGPLGGTSVVPQTLKGLYGKESLRSSIREWLINHWKWVPWVRLSLYYADKVYCANSQTFKMLQADYGRKCKLMLETGIDQSALTSFSSSTSGELRLKILWVGAIIKRKALALALKSIRELIEDKFREKKIELVVVGDGKLLQSSKDLASSLGISGSVNFLGRVDYSESKKLMKECDIFLFTSVNDTSGNVLLEAMSAAKPIVCLNHQGARDITTKECAIRVEVGDLTETVKGLTEGLDILCSDSELRQKMGAAGQMRIKDTYLWKHKAKLMSHDYHVLLGTEKGKRSPVAS